MIKINKFDLFFASLYDNNNNYIGEITSISSLLDLIIQICEQSLKGYYFMYRGYQVNITENRGVVNFPENEGPHNINLKLAIRLRELQQQTIIR